MAAATLAAGVISSQAQVYSQNIVGYVNQPIVNGFNMLANPLDASDSSGVNNNITNIINVAGGAYDGSTLFVWNGHGYTIYTLDSGQPTLVGNPTDSAAVVGPTITPGMSFYLNNNTGVAVTNTFVGMVHTDAAATGTQAVGAATNVIATGQLFYSSKLPIGGGLASVLQFPALSGALDGSTIFVPNITGSPAAVHGYTIYTVDSGQLPSGFGNATDSAEVPEPVIPVGGGLIINNNTGTAANWIQAL